MFDKAVTAAFRKVDDLATVWCEYAEMEMRHKYVVLLCEYRYRPAWPCLWSLTRVPAAGAVE